jgi:hypothetical protein
VVVNSLVAIDPTLMSIHDCWTLIGRLSVGVMAGLATAINRSRLLASMFVEALPTEGPLRR